MAVLRRKRRVAPVRGKARSVWSARSLLPLSHAAGRKSGSKLAALQTLRAIRHGAGLRPPLSSGRRSESHGQSGLHQDLRNAHTCGQGEDSSSLLKYSFRRNIRAESPMISKGRFSKNGYFNRLLGAAAGSSKHNGTIWPPITKSPPLAYRRSAVPINNDSPFLRWGQALSRSSWPPDNQCPGTVPGR
jgi:hypothetical protein